MKNILMYLYVILYCFSIWLFQFILMLIIFIPVLPLMLLAFPMMLIDATHWSCVPYLWYFNNIWLKILDFK